MSEHVTHDDILAFREQKLERARIEEVGAHVRECADCASRVWGSNEIRAAADAVTSDVRTQSFWWLAAAAALLAGIIGAAFFIASRRQAPTPRPVVRLTPSHPWDRVVADALARRHVDRPAWLADLRRSGDVVRGEVDRAAGVALLDPVGIAVVSQTPLFRWEGRPFATYVVNVVRNGDVIATSDRTFDQSWTINRPLDRDQTYEWQLVVFVNKQRFVVPSGDAPPALFRVVDGTLLDQARASGDHTAIGILAARLGLKDLAVQELIRSSDPRARAIALTVNRW